MLFWQFSPNGGDYTGWSLQYYGDGDGTECEWNDHPTYYSSIVLKGATRGRLVQGETAEMAIPLVPAKQLSQINNHNNKPTDCAG